MSAKITGIVKTVNGNADVNIGEIPKNSGRKKVIAPTGKNTPYVREGTSLGLTSRNKVTSSSPVNGKGVRRRTPVLEIIL